MPYVVGVTVPIKWDGPGPGSEQSGGLIDRAAKAFSAGATAESMDTMRAESGKMLASAKAGGFRISEEAGQSLRATLGRLRGRVEKVRGDLELRFEVAPQLGSHDYGLTVAELQHKAATIAPGSILTVLGQLQDVLEEAGQALDIAIKNYQEAEANASETFKSGDR